MTAQATALAFEVVVVGAGMAGATLALALAQGGLEVAIVDAQPVETRLAPSFDGRASAVADAGLRQWRALGLAEALAPEAQPIVSIEISDGSAPGAAGPGSLRPLLLFDGTDAGAAAQGEPLGWMVENRHVRAALNAALVQAGVTAFAPASVASIQAGAGANTLQLADGRRLSGEVVVGADGSASQVRRASGLGVNGWSYPQAGVVATVALDRPHEGVARQIFLPGGPLAILPLTQDRASLVWTERTRRADALTAASAEAFEAHLARRFGDRLGRPRLLGPRLAHPLRLQVADALVAPRTALVGDAAHVIHPIAGQGLNLGLKDAAALAEVLVDARRLGEDIGAEAVLARYARWRRFDAATLATATDLFTRLFSNDSPALRALRWAGLTLVNGSPAARGLFVRAAGAALGDRPRLLRGEVLNHGVGAFSGGEPVSTSPEDAL